MTFGGRVPMRAISALALAVAVLSSSPVASAEDAEARAAALTALASETAPSEKSLESVRTGLGAAELVVTRAAANTARAWGRAAAPLVPGLRAATGSKDLATRVHARVALVALKIDDAARWPADDVAAAFVSADAATRLSVLDALSTPPPPGAAARVQPFGPADDVGRLRDAALAAAALGAPPPALVRLRRIAAESKSDDVRAAAVESAPAVWRSRSWERATRLGGVFRGARDDRDSYALKIKDGRKLAAASDAAIDWLVRNQAPDGLWHPGALHARSADPRGPADESHRVGVTALAVLCLTGDANGRTVGARREAVRLATDALIRAQRPDGNLGDPEMPRGTWDHVLATWALVEAYMIDLDPALHGPAQRAIDFLERSELEAGGWMYPDAALDDPVLTAFACTAWAVAREIGLRTSEPGPLARAVARIDLRTDAEFGQVGYAVRGGQVWRPESLVTLCPPQDSRAVTACGVWIRALRARDARVTKTDATSMMQGLDVVVRHPPTWVPRVGRIDLVHCWTGTLACRQAVLPAIGVEKPWDKWHAALVTALCPGQVKAGGKDRSEPAAGSWNPECVWSGFGGRVYTTAVACLALQTSWRVDPFPELKQLR